MGFLVNGDQVVVKSGEKLSHYSLPDGEKCKKKSHGSSLTGFQKVSFDSKHVGAIGGNFAPRSNHFVTGDQQTGLVSMRSLDDPELNRTVAQHESPVTCVSFNHDGSRIASGDASGIIKISDPSVGVELLSIQAHAAPIREIVFSYDGSTMCTGDGGNVRLWCAMQAERLTRE